MAEPHPDLGALIDMQIRTDGPISIATYMGLCLTHPAKGYYRAADPLGQAGDFVTAPEISQMFGELVGAFVADLYVQMGSPAQFTLLELGPGRGTLARDALRAACRAPGFSQALSLALYETNPDLRAIQRAALADYAPIWIEDVESLPHAPVVVIANEFFDALPVRQFVKRADKWHERSVGLEGETRVFGLSPTPYESAYLPEGVREAPEGAVAEIGLAAQQFMGQLAKAVAPRGGAILAIDYGYEKTQPGETLQAVRGHDYADPLAAPGQADLSAHVDFEALGTSAQSAGLSVAPLMSQAAFLDSLGLEQRAEALGRANPSQKETIAAARTRLTDATQMGTLFKVLCAASPGLRPAGFTERA